MAFLRPRARLAVVIGLVAAGCLRAPAERQTIALATVSPERVAIAHRSGDDLSTVVDVVDPTSGAGVWSVAVPSIEPSEEALLAGDDLLLVVGRDDHPARANLLALDPATGSERWHRALDYWPSGLVAVFTGVWSHDGVIVFRATRDDGARLIGLDGKSGAELWHTGEVSAYEAPIFAGGALLVPTRHATQPPLRIVDIHSGASRDIGPGLAWPGIVTGARYLALFTPGQGGDALVTAEILRSGVVPPAPRAGPPAPGPRTGVLIVAVDPGTGAVTPTGLSAPDGCADPSTFTLWGTRLICSLRDGAGLWSRTMAGDEAPRTLVPEEGWRIWEGGSTELRLEHGDAWPYRDPVTRYVPAVLSQRGSDDARLCVLDLDELRFTWCSARKIVQAQIEIFGWLHIQRRGDLSLVHLPVHKVPFHHHGPLVVLDGRSGRFVGAVALRTDGDKLPGWPGTSYGEPRTGDVLVLSDGPFTWGLDLRHLALTFQRGPEVISVTDGLAEAEEVLGPLPR